MKKTALKMLQSSAAVFAAFAATAAGLLAIGPPAYAQSSRVEVIGEPQENPTRRVSYRDLNLATAAGEKAVTQRVTRAVSSVCYEAIGRTLVDVHVRYDCRSRAWAGARPQMALAIQRAREVAANGSSSIGAVTISVVAFAE